MTRPGGERTRPITERDVRAYSSFEYSCTITCCGCYDTESVVSQTGTRTLEEKLIKRLSHEGWIANEDGCWCSRRCFELDSRRHALS